MKFTGWSSLARVMQEVKQDDHDGLFEPGIL